MNVLSLFNGMSFGRMALDTMGVKVDNYYSSEIDKYANQAAQALFPDTTQLGDVTQWRKWDIDWASINLVTGGFPCQAWSMAGKQLGDKDERGMLFWTMLDIMMHIKYHNPKADFLIENVKMKKEFEQYITTHTENALGKVHKILINSALVSAQNRNRYYWTSFAFEQPEDKGVLLKDIIEKNADEKYNLTDKCVNRIKRYNNADKMLDDQDKSLCLVAGYHKLGRDNTYIHIANPCNFIKSAAEGGRGFEVRKDDKANCLLSDGHQSRWLANDGAKYRKLTPRECFRLQTVPEHHIDTLLSAGISNTQLYKMCGNGWTHDVITHILKHKFNGSK